jgi:hypothetical protein
MSRWNNRYQKSSAANGKSLLNPFLVELKTVAFGFSVSVAKKKLRRSITGLRHSQYQNDNQGHNEAITPPKI